MAALFNKDSKFGLLTVSFVSKLSFQCKTFADYRHKKANCQRSDVCMCLVDGLCARQFERLNSSHNNFCHKYMKMHK